MNKSITLSTEEATVIYNTIVNLGLNNRLRAKLKTVTGDRITEAEKLTLKDLAKVKGWDKDAEKASKIMMTVMPDLKKDNAERFKKVQDNYVNYIKSLDNEDDFGF